MTHPGRGRAAIWVGALLMLAALVTGISCLAIVGNRVGPALANAFFDEPITAPGQASVTLTPGTWSVYAADANAVQSGPGGTTSAAFRDGGTGLSVRSDLSTFDVTVTGPDGHQLVLRGVGSGQDTITRNGIDYLAELTFDVKSSGTYQVVVANNSGTQVFVAPSLRHLANFIPLRPIFGVGAAALVFLSGLLVLVLGLVASSKARQPNAPLVIPAAAPGQLPQVPAGWYPDPMRSATWRYWDGQGWTAHTG